MLSKTSRSIVSHLPRGRGLVARHIARHGNTQIVDMVGVLNGLQMELDTSDQFQALMSCGSYQPELVDELSSLIKPGDMVLTAGAHVGYMALVMAKLGARVIAFECDPKLTEVCQRNFSLNNLDTTLVPVGLGSEDSEMEMNVSLSAGQSSFGAPHHPDSKVKVRVRRGDDVLKEIGITKLDGLLIDVEGWECHLLEGLSQTLANCPRWAIIECSDWALDYAGRTVDDLRRIVSRLGFSSVLKGSDLVCTRSN